MIPKVFAILHGKKEAFGRRKFETLNAEHLHMLDFGFSEEATESFGRLVQTSDIGVNRVSWAEWTSNHVPTSQSTLPMI